MKMLLLLFPDAGVVSIGHRWDGRVEVVEELNVKMTRFTFIAPSGIIVPLHTHAHMQAG